MRPALAALSPLLVLAVACASTGPARPPVGRPAQAELPAAAREAAWTRALEVIQARGDQVRLADPDRGILVTSPREVQATCGERTCLARDILRLRLDGGRAQLVLDRRLFDDTVRAYLPPQDEAAVAAVEAEEFALLRAIIGGRPELRTSLRGEHCAEDAECGKGLACDGRVCR
jgi:hypothetical protein